MNVLVPECAAQNIRCGKVKTGFSEIRMPADISPM